MALHRAAELCKLLEQRCPGMTIKLNPSKVSATISMTTVQTRQVCCSDKHPLLLLQPRKGCFEIQDQTGKTYVSLTASKTSAEHDENT